MHEDGYEKQKDGGFLKIFGVLLPSLPGLLFRLTTMFLRFKRQANKAGKVFKKELVKQGLDKHTAAELTEMYMKTSEMKNYIQTFRYNL